MIKQFCLLMALCVALPTSVCAMNHNKLQKKVEQKSSWKSNTAIIGGTFILFAAGCTCWWLCKKGFNSQPPAKKTTTQNFDNLSKLEAKKEEPRKESAKMTQEEHEARIKELKQKTAQNEQTISHYIAKEEKQRQQSAQKRNNNNNDDQAGILDDLLSIDLVQGAKDLGTDIKNAFNSAKSGDTELDKLAKFIDAVTTNLSQPTVAKK